MQSATANVRFAPFHGGRICKTDHPKGKPLLLRFARRTTVDNSSRSGQTNPSLCDSL